MTTTPKVLIDSKQMENAETTQYTSSNCETIIDKFVVTNTTVGVITFSARIVKVGGTAGATPALINAQPIAAGKAYLCPELVGQPLDAGDFISTIAGAAASLTVRAGGRQIT